MTIRGPNTPRTTMIIAVRSLEHAKTHVQSTYDKTQGYKDAQGKASALKCDTYLIVANAETWSEQDRKTLKQLLRHWRSVEIEYPTALEEFSSKSRRQRHKLLSEYIANGLRSKLEERYPQEERRAGFIWDETWIDWIVAVSAASAAFDGCAWWDPPGAPDMEILPRRSLAHVLKEPEVQSTTQILGSSEQMQRVRKDLELYAKLPFPVLLIGETGTGKELCARQLHELSKSPGELSSVNGALLDSELASSELFGHIKGSFTGAHQDRKGRIEEAENGTFFLDELNSVPIAAQSKLLRALQDADEGNIEVVPVGGGANNKKTIQARLVSAVQCDPLDTNELRPDLYFRVASLVITIPPLRERGDDILELSSHFIGDMYNHYQRTGPKTIDKGAERALLEHSWPGNVRELHQALRHAWIHAMARNATTISRRDLPPRLLPRASSSDADFSGASLREQTARFVLEQIDAAKAKHPSNGAAAARSLGFKNKQNMERFREKHAKHIPGQEEDHD